MAESVKAEKVRKLLEHFGVFVRAADQGVMAEMQRQKQVCIATNYAVVPFNGLVVSFTRARTLQESAPERPIFRNNDPGVNKDRVPYKEHDRKPGREIRSARAQYHTGRKAQEIT
jgi:hypothetical protein